MEQVYSCPVNKNRPQGKVGEHRKDRGNNHSLTHGLDTRNQKDNGNDCDNKFHLLFFFLSLAFLSRDFIFDCENFVYTEG